MTDQTPTRYADDVETVSDEAAPVTATITTQSAMVQTFVVSWRATPETQAATHGVLTGSPQMVAAPPAELAQRMFARPGCYDVVMRYAGEPRLIDPEAAPARRHAMKVLDGPEAKVCQGWTGQDSLSNTSPTIPQGDATTYLKVIEQRDKHCAEYTKLVPATVVTLRARRETINNTACEFDPISLAEVPQ